MSDEWQLTFCLRAQSELLQASLDKIPENASKQRKAITRRLSQMFCDFVNQLSPPLVLEIEAHEGSFSKEIKKARPECRVIAFEPHPLVYARYAPAMKEAARQEICSVLRGGWRRHHPESEKGIGESSRIGKSSSL